ncbi:hypothetical protein [Micromonospora sp. NPDC048830]|uniref:hypothetical protein n=1 Tax=Micromonospora sp. NPDC048830 TaxID=3364257 RepID=UPI00371162B2
MPVDGRWIRGDASANRATFLACLGDSGDDCAGGERDAMPPGWLAFLLAVCLLAGAVGAWYLGWTLIDIAAEAIRDRRAGERLRTVGIWPALAALEVAWLVVFDNLAFGYALPRIGLEVNALAGVVLYPLYLAVLVVGLLIMIGYPVFAASLLRSRTRSAGRRLGLYAVVVAVLIGWRQIYLRFPAVAAGPFEIRTAWLNDALHTWPLQWPITVLWQTLRFFATPGGIAAFCCLALISGVLPDRRWGGRGRPARAVVGAVHGTAVNAAALLTGTATTIVVGVIAFAVLALAAAFLAAYAIYYLLAMVITGAMISWLVRR